MPNTPQFSDSDLLDYLDGLPVPEGLGWLVRPSSTGRGWRLATTSLETSHKTARAAIIAAMTGEHDKELALLFPGPQPGEFRHAITASEMVRLAERGLGSESSREAIVAALTEIRKEGGDADRRP